MPDTRIWNGSAADNAFDTAANWSGTAVPISGDSAIIPAMDAAAGLHIAGSDQDAILLVNLTVEPQCYLNIGSRLAYLQLDADLFLYEGGGYGFIDLDNCAASYVHNAPAAGGGYSYGLDLIGASNTLLVVDAGSAASIAVAMGATQTAGFTTIQANSGNLFLGSGLTCTTLAVLGGVVEAFANTTTLNARGGTVWQFRNTPTTLNVEGGTVNYCSAATLATANIYSGTLDFTKEAGNKTITNCTLYGGVLRQRANQITYTNAPALKGGRIEVV